MKSSIFFLTALTIFVCCKPKTKQITTANTQAVAIKIESVKKIDVHSHFRYSRSYLPKFFNKWNMQSVLVDVAIAKTTGTKRSWINYLAQEKNNPELFFLCSSLIGTNIDSPDFALLAIEQLEQEIGAGAKMVKVWKNFGMVTKDASGKFIQIDDKRLQPIWDYLIAKNIPVMAHIGEPLQAWRALNDPNNPHFIYYTDHPEYHAYKIAEIPLYETIITARDNWLKNNPKLRVLCAHLGSMSHNVDMVAERLEKYPNMYVELAARFGDLAGQDSEKVVAFLKNTKTVSSLGPIMVIQKNKGI